ncbi:sensor histidine kinase [Corynebacterium comes]|uniref:Histidine kinase/HSP90-like ATPase domain-containing protein n=1 Tax=Corynebacterium comes TaxID=2675218 RepID=A0A6B8VW38_9CORY|nr:ATP-binding protein [Corynebacterium comes]QGU04331.1 hypothetical protein CETAM_05305 [Corynebacterium comes]
MIPAGLATTSDSLPADFHAPAPLRRSGQLAEEVESDYLRSQTALLALYRVVAFGCGVSWLVFMGLGSNAAQLYRASLTGPPDSPASAVFWLFTVASLVVVAAGFVHRHAVYRWTLGLAGGSYVAVLALHLVSLVLTDESPLTQNYLGDTTGLPMAMLMAVLPGRAGLVLAVVTLAVAARVNLGTPLGWNTVLEVAHALILMLPFLMLLQAGRRASEALDRMVAADHREIVRLARMKALDEMETRFLGHLHDRVLSYLDGVWRGVVALDRSPVDPGKLLTMPPTRSTHLSLRAIVAGMVSDAKRLDPELAVSAPGPVPESATMPADVAASISDALLEAVSNGVRHAPGSNRALEIYPQVEEGRCRGMSVRVTDDGRGFDVDDVPRDRAGLRVAIAGRMAATPGCRAEIASSPGRGTRVELTWDPGLRDQREGQADNAAPVPVPTPYDLVGVGRIFRPRNAAVVMALVLGLSLNNTHPHAVAHLLALAAAGTAAWALVQGDALRLPARSTAVTAVTATLFLVAALVDDPPPAAHWPALWYPWVFVLLCTYLAIRDRALVAWSVWAMGLVAVELVGTPHFDVPGLVGMSILLLPATLIPRMVDMSTRGLGLAMASARHRATEVELVAARRAFLADSAGWVARQAAAALAPGLSGDARRHNAHLLELKLRDSIRSPLFDTPQINRAVWDARAAGARVRLLDDRSTDAADAIDAAGTGDRLARTRAALAEVLAGDAESVTARIYPAGRAVYATIVVTDPAGENHRIEIND